MGHLSGQDSGRESGPAEPGPGSGQGTVASDEMLASAAHTLCALKRTLKSDVGHFEKELTYRAGTEMFHCFMHREFAKKAAPTQRELMDRLVDMFARDGLGCFQLVSFDPGQMSMEFSCPDSLEAIGYLSHGESQSAPSCSFICGLLAGAGKYVFGSTDCDGPNEIVAAETSCAAAGAAECRFVVGKRATLQKLGLDAEPVRESVSEHALRLNDEILTRNLDLQNLNLDLERQVRRRSEEVKRAEDAYRALVNLSPDPIIVCLADGTIRSLNESALGMLGYGPEDRLESSNISAILMGGANSWERCIWLVNKEGVLRNQEFEFIKKKGGKVVGEVSARVSDTHPERCIHMVIRDVTERNLLKERMEDAKTECEFFNDILSHDIVNYMSAAMHFLDKVPASRGLTEDDKKALSMVAKDVRGAYELASVIRDLSRAEALEDGECRDATDICSMCDEAVDEARRLYPDRHVTITVDKPASTCYVEGGPLLMRMFVNILTNAIKFDTSDQVVIAAKIEPVTREGVDYWSIRVSDHGKGIPDREKASIFDRYFRGDTGVAGTGLGLYVVMRIARACGGTVWAEDRVKGDYTKGTVMVVLLRRVGNGNNHKH